MRRPGYFLIEIAIQLALLLLSRADGSTGEKDDGSETQFESKRSSAVRPRHGDPSNQ